MASAIKPDPERIRYIKALRQLTSEQRLVKAAELSEATHDLLRAGIRIRFPQAGAAELQRIYLERLERCRRRAY